MFKGLFNFLIWLNQEQPATFYICLTVLVLLIAYTHVLAYQFGKTKRRKEDAELIEQLEEDNSLGVNSSLRIATRYDLIGHDCEDDPIYN